MATIRTLLNLAIGGVFAKAAPAAATLAAAVFAAATLAARPAAAQAPEGFHLHAVTVSPAQPGKGDEERIKWRKKKLEDKSEGPSPVYIVKLYAEVPPAGARGYKLFVGEEPIREFGSFSEGIFFKVYHRQDLKKLMGKGIMVGKSGEAPEATGRSFPEEADLAAALEKPVAELGKSADVLSH
jgi:hypothetical protein